MKKILGLLLSRRYASSAMALLAALLAVASLAPQGEDLEALRARRPRVAAIVDRLQPAEIARSVAVIGLIAYVAVAVGASMVVRIRGHRAQSGRPLPVQRFVARRSVRVAGAPSTVEARVRKAFAAEGHRLDAALAGSRGRTGFWGSMAFHGGLLVGLLGVALSARGRFHGEILLAEGFSLVASPTSLIKAEPVGGLGALTGTRLTLSDVSATYDRGTRLTDVAALLEVRVPGRETELRFLSVNVPTTIEGYQLTVHAYGYAPELVALDSDGRVLAEGNVALRVLPPGTRDGLALGKDARVDLWFFPDHAEVAGRHVSRSLDPVNPVLAFEWHEGGRSLGQGIVPKGGSAVVSGRTLTFRDSVYWVDFIVARDPGLPWFAAGAFLCVFGLAVRYALHERSWRVTLAPADGGTTAVELTLSARYLPVMLAQIAGRIVSRFSQA